ncbi:hypothetical protein HNV08_07660, partial [Winogradskyella eckloniae]|uniref:SdrD B-like domain-containing protein n=1 Tax=Winogradskyella eckloniae TaxID=1089306 RepID=UPI0021CE3D88
EDEDGIQDPGEEGVAGVTVNLLDCNNNQLATTTTDANGNYSFADLDPNEDYKVEFEVPTGYELSPANHGGNDSNDSDAGSNGRTSCIDLEPGENDPTIDAGIYLPCSIDPSISLSTPDNTICYGTSVVLTAIGGDQFVWKANDIVLTNETSSTLTVSPNQTTVYSVVVTDSSQYNCSAEVMATIVVNPATDDINEEVTICEGSDYTWSQNGQTYTAADSPVVLELTDSNGCSYSATLVINEYDATEDVVTEVTVCEGSDYTWSQNGETYTAADSPVVLTIDGANGCSYTATLIINEYEETEDIVHAITVCEGESRVWSFNGVAYTAADSPVVLELTDDNGCPYTATLNIYEYEAPENTLTEVTVCEGSDYTWSENGVTYTAADSPVVLDLSDNNGCSYTATLVINEYDAPEDVVTEVTVCEGSDYTWSENGQTYTAADSPVVLTIDGSNGCSYTATLIINEYEETEDIVHAITVCEGESRVWSFNGVAYTAADSPVVLELTDDNGCPYTATLNIYEYEAPENTLTEVTVCEGVDYTWSENGVTYTTADSPVVLDLSDNNGCAYTATLVINEYDAPEDVVTEVTVCEGSDYTWSFNGVTYTAADSPVVLDLSDANGCAYTAMLVINESNTTEDVVTEVTVCEGSDYTWSQNGQTYTAADSPVVLTIDDASGCSYTATLVINEYDAPEDVVTEVTVCEGSDYTWLENGVTYTAADSPVVLDLSDANGCAYTATLVINESNATEDVVTEVTVCEGSDYTWSQNGQTYTAVDSPVVLTIDDASGCSYTATLVINEYDAPEDVVTEVTVCEGSDYTWSQNGETYTAADSPVMLTIDGSNGCSYTATLIINEYEETEDIVHAITVCEGESRVWSFNGVAYTAADSPVVLELTDDNGCPYTATLNIYEYEAPENTLTEVTVCEGSDYTWSENGVTYTAADSPVVLDLSDANGCAYTATLVINESNATEDVVTEVTVCEGSDYTWSQNGQTYTAADSPVVLTIDDASGCSYTATLVINEYDAPEDVVTEVTVCEGLDYTWSENGVTYTAADSPVVLDLSDANGCAYTATLVINENDAIEDVVTEVSVCEGSDYTWSQDGQTYTASDSPVVLELTHTNGCHYTAILVINEYDAPEDVVTEVTICEGSDYTWSETGVTYTAADSPVVLELNNANGCAYTSTLIINESGNTASNVYEQVTVCYGGDYTWALSGETYTVANSPVVLELTTDNGCPYTATLVIVENQPVCDSVTEVSICEDATYTWAQNGETYTVADSPVVLHLTDLNGYNYTAVLIIYGNGSAEDVVDEVTICEGSDYTWDQNGVTYTAADSPVVLTMDNGNGCSYTATLVINEYDAPEDVVTEVTVCEGSDYTWSETGVVYTAADSPVVVELTNTNGCVYTTTLVINESNASEDIFETVTICEGEDYTWSQNGQTYTVADSPVVLTIDDNSGCSYTATLTINEYDAAENVVTEVLVCEGTEYVWSQNGQTYTAADSPVVLSLSNANGCAYTSTLIINEHVPVNTIVTEVTVCSGEAYTWSQNDETYTAADSPVVLNLTNVNGCAYTATLTINEFAPTEDIVTEVTVCEGEDYTWSQNGETYTAADSPVVLDLMDNNGCGYTTTLIINEENKVKIGNYVWLDVNENGIQDEGVASGINGVTVRLFHCNDDTMIDSDVTMNNSINGEPGYYEFEVCANSGDYYIKFNNAPEGYEFTSSNVGDDTLDSDVNNEGVTACFTVEDSNVITIDAGLFNVCSLNVDAGTDMEICPNETVTLSASFDDVEGLCEGGCVYPVLDQERCDGPAGTFEVWVVSSPSTGSYKFNASQQSFETFDNGTAKYVATVSNGIDVLQVDFTYSGYTTVTPMGSPKLNDCQTYDTSGYEYYTELTGTITSQNHGVFTVAPMGESFQIGMGADVKRLGFGASGWYTLSGGDGTYTTGDVNLALGACQPKAVDYQWTTADGHIVGNANQETITVDQAGTYTVQAVNCIDCVATDTVVVTSTSICNGTDNDSHSLRVYPVPASSDSSVTIDLDIVRSNSFLGDDRTPIDIEVSVYDARGRLVHSPRTYQVIAGKNLLNYELGTIDLGTYVMQITADGWSATSRLIVE